MSAARKTKQICDVYDCVAEGANTSRDVADVLGLPVKHASAQLTKLRQAGVIRWTGRFHPRSEGEGGRACRVYSTA